MSRKNRFSRIVFVGALIACVLASSRDVHVQSPASLSSAVVTRVGVVVPDVEATAKKYGEVFGVAVPRIQKEAIDPWQDWY